MCNRKDTVLVSTTTATETKDIKIVYMLDKKAIQMPAMTLVNL